TASRSRSTTPPSASPSPFPRSSSTATSRIRWTPSWWRWSLPPPSWWTSCTASAWTIRRCARDRNREGELVNFQRGQEKEPLEINLVPLIDVMMVILIFLMITTTYNRYAELQINLPSADADKQAERSNEIAVLVNAQGQYV